MDNFFSRQANGGAVFMGRTLVQAHGNIGGYRNVFVKIVNSNKGALSYPTSGGIVKNPFPGRAKIYAGDFCEYTPNLDGTHGAEVKILKFYEAAKEATSSDVTIKIVHDDYRHIPFVGDNIMVGQKDFAIENNIHVRKHDKKAHNDRPYIRKKKKKVIHKTYLKKLMN